MTAARFVIVAHPRTGSHMVASALESRGDVLCNREPFGLQPPPAAGPTLAELWSPAELGKWAAVGFILHRTQCALGESLETWRLLAADPAVRIIMLHRRSQVARHISHHRARESGRYGCNRPPRGRHRQAQVDPFKLAQDSARYWRLLAAAYRRFRRHPMAMLEFEQPDYEAAQLLLGLECQAIAPTTHRQECRPMAQAVANWQHVAHLDQ